MAQLFFLVIDSVAGKPRYYVAERGVGDHFNIVAKCPTQFQAERIVKHLNTNIVDTEPKKEYPKHKPMVEGALT